MKPLHRQNREFPFFEISCKPTMLQRNDYDFRNQRKILVLEMFEIPGAQTLTNSVINSSISKSTMCKLNLQKKWPHETSFTKEAHIITLGLPLNGSSVGI